MNEYRLYSFHLHFGLLKSAPLVPLKYNGWNNLAFVLP